MKYLLILTLYMTSITSVAQSIEITTASYDIGDYDFYQLAYKIKNDLNESMWVWFDKGNNLQDLSSEEKVKNHFMKRTNPTEPSPPILQIYMDANVEKAVCSIPDFFITIIPPSKTFTFYIIANNFNRDFIGEEIASFMKSNLCLVNESEIAKFSTSLLDESVYNLLIYKNKAICLEWTILKTVLLNNP